MRVGLLNETGQLALVDRSEPRAGPGELLVSMAACGVCGTDLEKLRGNYRTAGILGHEPVGVVVAKGEQVAGLELNDRVFVHHHVPCYECPVCRRGDWTFCPTFARTNIDPGGFSERFRAPRENVERKGVLKLHPSVGWDVGALLEPAGCALTALHRVGFSADWSVFVLGLGPVGLLYARLARALGANWIGASEASPLRRRAAERGKIDSTLDPNDTNGIARAIHDATGNEGVDLVVVATGAPAAVRLAATLPRRGGTINLFGLPERGSRLDHDLQELYLRGIRVIPSYATTDRDIQEVQRLFVEGNLPLADLVSHRVPLERIEEAFALAGRPQEALKVVVTGPAD